LSLRVRYRQLGGAAATVDEAAPVGGWLVVRESGFVDAGIEGGAGFTHLLRLTCPGPIVKSPAGV
jgi:hypothetical protein